MTRLRGCQSSGGTHLARMRFGLLLLFFLTLTCRSIAAAPDSPAPPPERTPVPLAPEAFADFIGRYQREDMTVLVFQSRGHFFIKVDDRPRAEIFPLSDHEFFLHESPDKLSFERDDHGIVTHFIRHSTAPQLFRRVR
jgi:hypothetical protein